jgi:murein DD-endopeptidase MepM/ murein hydrolase activator NlpD
MVRKVSATIGALLAILATVALPQIDTFQRTLVVPRATAPSLVYPVMGPELSSDFGLRKHPIRKVTRHHDGVDLAAPLGAPIRSIAAGIVIFADPWGGYGKFVVIKHSKGMTSHYGHMEKISVAPGQRLKAGDIIGTVGNTGISTGPHLHFEIRVNGKIEHPEKFLPGLALDGAG